MAPAHPIARRASASPHIESLHGLDGLNFFLAALLTGSGPFVAVKLADRGWAPQDIGLVLTAGGLAGLLSQIPAGELIDVTRSKRALVGIAAGAVILGILVFGLRSDFPSIFGSSVVRSMAGSILGPAIAAIALGLVGRDALPDRLGRNQRFASLGGLAATAITGAVGYLLSIGDIFLLTAAFGIPVLLFLCRIHAADIDFGRSCCAPDDNASEPQRVSRAALLKDHRLLAFAICLFLFQLANASILPLKGQALVHAEGRFAALVLSALIVVPEIVVAVLAPWVGRTADSWGRRPLLLIGLGVVPIRAAFFALPVTPTVLIAVQSLDGLTGATLGVLTALVISDLAQGTGRFNLAQGLVGTLSGIGASLSTSISGFVVERFGQAAGFLCVATAGLMAVAILWAFIPETKSASVPPRPEIA